MFDAFLATEPNFAGDAIKKWEQPTDESDFPDVICTTASDRRVGVELGEWLNEDETTAAKRLDRIQQSLLNAIGEQGENTTEFIYCVWLVPRPKSRIKETHRAAFRSELFKLISEIDAKWPNERFWQDPQGHEVARKDLATYPTLRKFLNGVRFFPTYERGRQKVKRRMPSCQHWILLPPRVDTFSDDTMPQPLLALIEEKIAHYGHAGTGFDRLYLLIYYNSALIHNSPVETPRFKFEGAVNVAKDFVSDDAAPFDGIILFIAVDNGRVLNIV